MDFLSKALSNLSDVPATGPCCTYENFDALLSKKYGSEDFDLKAFLDSLDTKLVSDLKKEYTHLKAVLAQMSRDRASDTPLSHAVYEYYMNVFFLTQPEGATVSTRLKLVVALILVLNAKETVAKNHLSELRDNAHRSPVLNAMLIFVFQRYINSVKDIDDVVKTEYLDALQKIFQT